MYKHTNEQFICEYCSATYKYPHKLQAHIRKLHPEKCNGRTYFAKKLQTSETNSKSRNNAKEKKTQCKYCSKTIAHKVELKLHLESQHKDLFIHKCDLCENVYMSVASRQLHRKIAHTEKNNAVKCKWCLKKVNHKNYLYNHMTFCKKKPDNLVGAKIAIADTDEDVEEDSIVGHEEKFVTS